MKLDTDNYKLTIYTEDACPDCLELKEKLTEEKIPFENKSITHAADRTNTANWDKEKADNRWDFVDLSREYPNNVKFTPVMVIDSLEGKRMVWSLTGGFENAEEALQIVKENYCI
tara:strand:- start:858 stop:1202 length:345 start_codon:yes stop_codon:yes gene_type:complete